MRNIMIFAAVMIGLGTFMAQMADRMTPALASSISHQAVPVAMAAPVAGRTVNIPHDARGHFATDGRIEGQRIGFMVDTGASVVALNESSAARFGLRPSRGDYNATVTTANGTIKAARTRIAMVDVGGLVVRDVDAARRGAVGEPARPVVPVEAEALRVCQRHDGVGTVRPRGCQSTAINPDKPSIPPSAPPRHSLWLQGSAIKAIAFSVS